MRIIKSKLTNYFQDRLIGQKLEKLQELNDICLEIEMRQRYYKEGDSSRRPQRQVHKLIVVKLILEQTSKLEHYIARRSLSNSCLTT